MKWSLATLALGGCAETDTRPEPPDLGAQLAAYEAPSAELDLEAARMAVLDALPELRAVRSVETLRFLLDAVQNVSDGFVLRGLSRELHADLDGYVRVRTVCPGPDRRDQDTDDAPDAERDGTIELSARLTDAALEPVLFGAAHGCRFGAPPEGVLPSWLPLPAEPFEARLDGPIAVHLGSPLVLGRQTRLAPLLRVDGALAIDGLPELRGFDFRVPDASTLELSVALGVRGNVVLVLAQDDLRLREARGTWRCMAGEEVACSAEF